jgi:hypothetical protein
MIRNFSTPSRLAAFILFSAIALISANCIGPSGIVISPAINVFDANPGSINAGATSTLNWNVTGANSVDIQPGIGRVALTGTRTVSPATSTVYTLTAVSPTGSSTATTQVLVSATSNPPATTPAQGMPVINQFVASPNSIYPGSTAELTWNVSNATMVSINTIGNVPASGKISVNPAATTVYSLTAANSYGSTSATAQVSVYSSSNNSMPTINEFRAVPTVIYAGSSATLTWNVSNSTDVYIIGVGSVLPSGTASVSPYFTTSYWLIARNSYGSANSYALVVVTQGQLGSAP